MNSTPSATAQILISIIPIVGIVTGSVIVFFSLLWNHRQKTRLIERGIAPTSDFDVDTFSLLTGLLAVSVGAVLSLVFLLIDGVSYVLLGGLTPFAVGIGLLVFYSIRRKSRRR